ncbi:tetratricopeptide repeat protein [Sinorhizobium sp. NFACC03]|uniref:tetratricopeptide repeat protein n=1 Tax=Sinorhizobium sp. NFACC03 TaxID=1566295 RepID=UPI0008903971|nr:tetratricopeptide repeat protein [Sinorhizobium sp. NFACC03]SDA84757.1 Tetratrico peptide repeat-containing protein [Sinorhizobium sp. NFACC03]
MSNVVDWNDWERRLAELWAAFDTVDAKTFIARIEALAAELPAGHAIGLFEQASAQDSTGHETEAEPLYRQALENGLTGIRRRRATIQLASTLRNLGRAGEGVALLTAEQTKPSDELDDAVAAFLALCLVDVGHAKEAAALALGSLSRHLPRYNRSLKRYADALLADA